MNLDWTSGTDLFEFVREGGYTGEREEWWDELRRQEYAAAAREFAEYGMAITLNPDLRTVFHAGGALALTHFERVHTSCGGSQAYVSFTQRRDTSAAGVRLSHLTVDVFRSNERALVHIQGYVNGKRRLDLTLIAPERGQS